MSQSGTEAEIINCVAKLRQATKDQIRREVSFSLDYKGYLNFSGGYYSLAKAGRYTYKKSQRLIESYLRKLPAR